MSIQIDEQLSCEAVRLDNREDHSNQQYELFVRLLVEHERDIKVFLRTLLADWSDVDEVLQDTSLVAWRKFSQFEAGTNFRGWILTIARYEAFRYRKKVGRKPLCFSDSLCQILIDESDRPTESQTQKMNALEQCLMKLSKDKCELLLSAHTRGVFTKDIAAMIGKSEQSLYKMIQRLRATVVECVRRTMRIEETI
jgi:RNA polymerase sigma-70 factor, ECF subfamily